MRFRMRTRGKLFGIQFLCRFRWQRVSKKDEEEKAKRLARHGKLLIKSESKTCFQETYFFQFQHWKRKMLHRNERRTTDAQNWFVERRFVYDDATYPADQPRWQCIQEWSGRIWCQNERSFDVGDHFHFFGLFSCSVCLTSHQVQTK